MTMGMLQGGLLARWKNEDKKSSVLTYTTPRAITKLVALGLSGLPQASSLVHSSDLRRILETKFEAAFAAAVWLSLKRGDV